MNDQPEHGGAQGDVPAGSNPHARLLARCRVDEVYKRRLIADPIAVLAEAGISVPSGVTVRVIEDTAQVRNLVIPAPHATRLAGAGLEQIAAGLNCDPGFPDGYGYSSGEDDGPPSFAIGS